MKLAKKAGALILAFCLAAASFAGCGEVKSTDTDGEYTVRIKNVEDYIADGNVFPVNFDKSEGKNLFTFDAWSLEGTKVNINDDGEAVGCYWDITLDVDDMEGENIYSYYRFTLMYHGEASDSYTQSVDASYSWEGICYENADGYHLFAPDYGEAWLVGQAFDQTGGFGAGDGSNPNVQYSVASDGSTIYKYYTNSNLQAAGYAFGFPFMVPLCSVFAECDVTIENNEITGFANTTAVKGSSYPTTAGIDEEAVDTLLEDYGLINAAVEENSDIVNSWTSEDGTLNLNVTATADGVNFAWTSPMGGGTKTTETTNAEYNKVSGIFYIDFGNDMGAPGVMQAELVNGSLVVSYTGFANGAQTTIEKTLYLGSNLADTDNVEGVYTAEVGDAFGSVYPVTATVNNDGTISVLIEGFSTDNFVGTYENSKGVLTISIHHEEGTDKNGNQYTEAHEKWFPSYDSFNNHGNAVIILQSDGTFIWGPIPANY